MIIAYAVALAVASPPPAWQSGEEPIPPAAAAAVALATYSSGGCGLWFFAPATSSMGCLTKEFAVGYRISADASIPSAFAVDAHGRVIYANPGQSRIEWMSSDGEAWGAIELESRPISLTMGPRGEVWFATTDGVGHLTNDDHVVYIPAKTSTAPLAVWSRLGFPYIWIIEKAPGSIGRLDSDGNLQEFHLSRCPKSTPGYEQWSETPSAISDGNSLWLVRQCGDPNLPATVVKMSSNGSESDYAARGIGEHRAGLALVVDDLWFTEFERSKIGRLEPTGRITEYPTPSADAGPTAIEETGTGRLWFIESRLNKLGWFQVIRPRLSQ